MVVFSKYVEGILKQISNSYTLLANLKNKPGDLDIIKKELAKITGLLQVLTNKIASNPEQSEEYRHILPSAKYYLENHDFFREIDTMSLLYAEDSSRLNSLRLSILDALDEKNLIGHITAFVRGIDS